MRSKSEQTFVTEGELTKERSPEELAVWIEYKMAEIAAQDGGKEAVRLRKGLCKQLVEEVYALHIFAQTRFNGISNITLRAVLGNQNYDAIITDNSSQPAKVSKIEITQANEGEGEYLQRLMLNERKWAPAAPGQIEKRGTKNTGIVLTTKTAAVNVEEYPDVQIGFITSAFSRKIGKNYEPGTELLIMFDDVLGFREEEHLRKLSAFVNTDLGSQAAGFSAIHVVGWSGETFISWPPNR